MQCFWFFSFRPIPWQQYEDYQDSLADHHGKVVVSDSAAVPSVELSAFKDELKGWNIHLETENFTFTPQNFGGSHIAGQGHAHLYIDGQKEARIYGSWYHIPQLLPGKHTLRVTLNANMHDEYVFEEKVIADTTVVMVE